MGKINVLGFDVANLIAAGEVVDRPASVVKELCENSIDAGADSITVEIRHGGTSFIRVTDNGCGIDADDLPLTVLRHATSKIATAEDLASICTLGFRGEALAAIASVCKMKILSRTKDSPLGNVMTCEGGEISDLSETGCSIGTTVIASELFYNVPARRKFLKKDASECAAVTAVMEKMALSSPNVSIKYVTDGEVRFMTSGDGDLKNVIYSVYGKAVSDRMTPVKRMSPDGICVEGYIGEPDAVRANKNSENFFINGRFIKSRTAMAAIEQAYSTRIPNQKFPICVLNIKLNPGTVDVNVHPSKLEVKFANERIIFEAVYYAVLNALENNVSRPEMKLPENRTANTIWEDALKRSYPEKKPGTTSPAPVRVPEQKIYTAPLTQTSKQPSDFTSEVKKQSILNAFVPVKREQSEKRERAQITIPTPNRQSTPTDVKHEEIPFIPDGTLRPKDIEIVEEKNDIPAYTIIGEAYKCYVILELEDRLLIIDKHAAHERILFDEMCRRMKEKTRRAQVLMYPIKIRFSDSEKIVLEEYGEKIRDIGFNYQIKGSDVYVTEIPEELGRDAAEDMINELITGLSESVGSIATTEAKYFDSKLYQASCKAAMKGGRVYGSEHIKWICDRLLKKPGDDGAVIKTCPHGRPVAFEIKKTSVERQFERLV